MRIPRARWALALAFFLSIVPTAPGGQDPAAWRLETTDLRIELDPGRSRLRGEARLSLAAAVPGDDAIVLDLNDELSVASVTDPSGHPLAFEREGARLTVRPADRSGALILRVAYEGTFSKRNVNVGYYPAWIGPELAYGLSGAWYPQQAGDVNQARGSISYLVPAGWTVARATTVFCGPRPLRSSVRRTAFPAIPSFTATTGKTAAGTPPPPPTMPASRCSNRF